MTMKSNSELEIFQNRQTGAYACLRCGKPLIECMSIADKEDDEGFDWRSFHLDCCKEELLEKESLEAIYNSYPTNRIYEERE